MTRQSKPDVALDWGDDEPILLTAGPSADITLLQGPSGLTGHEAGRRVADVLGTDGEMPPLSTHVVPGDRVVIAVCDTVPQGDGVIEAVRESLEAGGISRHETIRLDSRAFREAGFALATAEDEARTAYLASDAEGEPLHLAREIVDADVVVTIGEWSLDATLPGRSTQGEIWPGFSRRDTYSVHDRRMLLDKRGSLVLWRHSLRTALEQLGVIAALRLVRGRDGSLADAFFGSPDRTARDAKQAAAGWRPRVTAAVDCTIFSLHRDAAAPMTGQDDRPRSLEDLVRGVAAAARITTPDGTICACCHVRESPGPVVARWREGVPLRKLVREAFRSGDDALVADARLARSLASSLGARRLVLLSDIDPDTVEMLGFGHAESPDSVRRLARASRSVAVLHEADRMLPVRPPSG